MRLLVGLGMLMLIAPIAYAQFGDCSAAVKVQWLDDGRKMELLDDFLYVDGGMKRWLAPKHSVIDGASIPRFLWSFVGGPFEGLYRKASVVHDVECEDQKELWRDVHRMFFNAMRCSGVGPKRANIMYSAVYHCGPRWGDDQGVRWFPCNSAFMKQFVRRWKTLAYQNVDLTIEDLESITPERLAELAIDPIEEIRKRLGEGVTLEEREADVLITVPIGTAMATAPSAATLQTVRDIGEILKDVPAMRVRVEGFADASGDEQLNLVLSTRRAETIATQLASAGVPPDKLRATSYGEDRPIAPNETKAGRAANRRVEIVIEEGL
jgi:hypothetical protein